MNKLKIKELYSHFKLPIFYNDSKEKINSTIVRDLELVVTNNEIDKLPTNINVGEKDDDRHRQEEEEKEEEEPIYKHIFSPSTSLGLNILPLFSEYYTNDTRFLKDTQKMLFHYSKNNQPISQHHYQNILNAWNEIKNETGFCEKYLYIDWDFCKFLNTNPIFLQAMTVYNITSPILSLFLPVFILIIPFFIIKLKGLSINMNEYVVVLKTIATNHAIGKIFTQFNKVDTSEKIYILVSAAFYIFTIYQNILVCIRFYSNAKKIHDYLLLFKTYITETIEKMNQYIDITNQFKTYENFNKDVIKNKNILLQYKNTFDTITPFKVSFTKILHMGHILKCFYELYDNKELNDSLVYSFGFNGYLDNISGLSNNISNKNMNKAIFNNTKTGTNVFKKAFYPSLIHKSPITNSYNLKKNMIITGPNASGKTTLLKTTLINVLLSQQIGFGCYKSAKISPFKFIHCYLNIPDTSGRDSLFQAEARRCKEIIDCIHENPKDKHFCVFDELYSGTNPEEASISAQAFMEYISKSKSVSCILTTHYIDLCKNLSNNNKIQNYNMKTVKTANSFQYTYSLIEGISEIKGGLKVLSDMNYPSEILNKTFG